MKRPPASGKRQQLGRTEFIALAAMMMALTALSIDLILPAFDEMREEFGLAPDSPETAGLVTAFLLGLALPQLGYGPLADRYGRKPLLYVGYVVFAVGAIICATASSFEMILIGRVIWGVGAAGPRVISVSMIRDLFEGEHMARVMSFIMAVFILIPVVAPSVGAGIVAIAPWRGVFWFCVASLLVVALWSTRLQETLDPSNRIDLNFSGIRAALGEVVRSRQTMGYLIAMGFINGVFVSYLASSELIWTGVFGLGDQFPLIFGGLAIVLGLAMLSNSLIVGRVGVQRLVQLTLGAYLAFSLLLLGVALATSGEPAFWLFLAALALPLAMHGLLIPNLNTLAMTPVGRVAGTASAVIGTVATATGALLGLIIDRAFNGTVTPLAMAFVAAGVAALITVTITGRANTSSLTRTGKMAEPGEGKGQGHRPT